MAFHNPEMCVSRDAGSSVRQTFSALGAIGLFSLLSGTNNGLFAHWPSASVRPGGASAPPVQGDYGTDVVIDH